MRQSQGKEVRVSNSIMLGNVVSEPGSKVLNVIDHDFSILGRARSLYLRDAE